MNAVNSSSIIHGKSITGRVILKRKGGIGIGEGKLSSIRSTLPDTRSIGPNAAMGSPIFIYRRNLLSWFEVE